jgi:hypothetical protein
MMRRKYSPAPSWTVLIFMASMMITSVAAWITHVLTCIQTEQWLFLIAGAIAAPVGIIHGVGLWFGAW